MSATSVLSHRTQLVLTAVSACVITSTLFAAYNAYSRRERRRDLDQDVLRSITTHGGPSARRLSVMTEDTPTNETYIRPNHIGPYNEDLVKEQLARNYAFFGDEGMAHVRAGSVVVVGCGGVGSWAAVMLVRSCVPLHLLVDCLDLACCSGVSRIRLVDFDYVTLSSLNRHATATLADVGTPKVGCIERTLKQIAPWVQVDSRVEIWTREDGGKLLEGADWVIGKLGPSTLKHGFISCSPKTPLII